MTFVPCFLWIFLGAPYVERLRGNRGARRRAGARSPPRWSASSSTSRSGSRCTSSSPGTAPISAFGVSTDLPVPASLDPAALVLTVGAVVAVFRLPPRHGRLLAGVAACSASGGGRSAGRCDRRRAGRKRSIPPLEVRNGMLRKHRSPYFHLFDKYTYKYTSRDGAARRCARGAPCRCFPGDHRCLNPAVIATLHPGPAHRQTRRYSVEWVRLPLAERALNGLAWAVALAASRRSSPRRWRPAWARSTPGAGSSPPSCRSTSPTPSCWSRSSRPAPRRSAPGRPGWSRCTAFPGSRLLRGAAGPAARLPGLRARLCLHRLPVASRPGAEPDPAGVTGWGRATTGSRTSARCPAPR